MECISTVCPLFRSIQKGQQILPSSGKVLSQMAGTVYYMSFSQTMMISVPMSATIMNESAIQGNTSTKAPTIYYTYTRF